MPRPAVFDSDAALDQAGNDPSGSIKLGVRSRAAMVFRCARHLEMQPPPQP